MGLCVYIIPKLRRGNVATVQGPPVCERAEVMCRGGARWKVVECDGI